MPKQVSSITSVKSSFAWSGGSGDKDFNATYDIWFASSPPTAGSYQDGINALLMVWLYKPGSRTPIGSIKRTFTDSRGAKWDVWVGPRTTTAVGATDTGRPVISYVAQQTMNSTPANFDLKEFFSDAAANGASDKNAGGTSIAFSNSLYLTDVFAGFEIWTGSNATNPNLTSTGFTAVVQ